MIFSPMVFNSGYKIKYALDLNTVSQKLTRTYGSSGNRKKWSISLWIKRISASSSNSFYFLDAFIDDNYQNALAIRNTNTRFHLVVANSYVYDCTFNIADTALSNWVHILFVYDSDNPTENSRAIAYKNGVQATRLSGTIPLGTNTYIGDSGLHKIYSISTLRYYIADYHYLDGIVASPTDFAQTLGGIWTPKEYTGSFGTKGYHLNFENASDLGNDVSGNNNDFTATGMTTANQITNDTP